VIDKGEADVIMAFELLEAARWVEYLKVGGLIVTNTQQVNPMPVITGAAAYPADLVASMRSAGVQVDADDFLKIAEEAGSSKAVNIALLGRISHSFPDISVETWLKAIEASVPAKFLEMNRKAFLAGRGE